MDVKVPTFLFIRGVFKSMCQTFEEFAIEKYSEDTKNTDDSDSELDTDSISDTVPRYFIGKSEWPSGVAIKCNVCFGTCKKNIICIPKNIESESGLPKWPCTGAFDSWYCAAWYIKYFMSNDSRYKLYLQRMYKELTGHPRYSELTPGIPPWELKECGGSLTRDEYQNINESNDKKMENIAKQAAQGLPIHESTTDIPILVNESDHDVGDHDDDAEYWTLESDEFSAF